MELSIIDRLDLIKLGISQNVHVDRMIINVQIGIKVGCGSLRSSVSMGFKSCPLSHLEYV